MYVENASKKGQLGVNHKSSDVYSAHYPRTKLDVHVLVSVHSNINFARKLW